ncbi:T9SS sorting signal type C domain-containing protein [Flavobacterium azooxidireducens]|uniref:T9SS sorting signal type C domain-containing protein n=1 Tax=Flavobacterium azooxidireducens TaxID=1871076 RepID=A0ABY4KEQ2_9FLAO|nr:T9SS sorting signal type C domain-containing protein [Flavobacterium azooxidireducens]UPQ77977.1 T9SS sorting signal type C domain-containing protein [Flavobacterium azooxidireducens]
MNKFLLLALLFVVSGNGVLAQSASSYTFTATTATYSNLSSPNNITGLNNSSDDDLSNAVSIGFTFNFAGTNYTQFKVSSNGFITFNVSSTDAFFDNTIANAGTSKPILMPLWDDLQSTTRVRYRLEGTSPSRIMKIEFRGNEWNYDSGADAIKFQVWLYETSNRIEYRYQQSSDPVNNPSATIGIYDANDTYLTLNGSGSSPSASSTTFTTTINAKPASNQVFRFDPPSVPVITSSAASLSTFSACNLTVSNSQTFLVSGVSLTANIVITAPTGFEVSTDNVNFFDTRTLTQSGGNVATTTIYARMKSLATNPTSGNITIASTGATTRNISVTGLLLSPTGVSAGSDVAICASSSVVLDGNVAIVTGTQTLSSINNEVGFTTMTTNDLDRWGISNTSNAGGSAAELQMQYFSGSNPTPIFAWAQSPLLDATDYTDLSMTFKHNVDWFSGTVPLFLQTSTDGTTWTTQWNLNATANVAANTVTVNLSSVDNTSFYYRFLFDGNIYNIDFWFIDDITITGTAPLPATYSWTSVPPGFTSSIQDPTVNPTVTTTYTLAVTRNGCTVTDEVVVTVASTIWNGAAWSNGEPTSTKAALFEGDFTSSTDINACSITVTNNAEVVISTGDTVTLSGGLTVNTGSAFTLENDAYLMQSGTTNLNNGAITVEKLTQDLMRLDYVLWSSPVENQNLLSFSPLTVTNRFYTYNSSSDSYSTIAPGANNFSTGKGYLIRMPDNHPTSPTAWQGSFVGKPNSGDLSIALSTAGGGYNAVGNPYPSPISIEKFLDDNSSLISGDLYFWRKTNNTLGSAYVTFSGGAFSDGPHSFDNIQPGQGFFVKANNAGNLQFNNLQRELTSGVFYRNEQIAETSRIWLHLKNNNSIVGNMAIGYRADATNEIDSNLDGEYINDSSLALNSIVAQTELSVQHRAEFVSADVVPLSFKTNNAGSYEIAINTVDGLFLNEEQQIFLKDNLLSIEHNLKNESYSFVSDAGTFANRFEIIYQSTLSVENPVLQHSVVVFSKDKTIQINSGLTTLTNVKVFDLRGRLLAEQNDVNASTVSIPLTQVENQVLIVQITSTDGQTTSKKVAH